MSFTETCNRIFNQAIADYHVKDDIDTPINNPYQRESIENRLYLKSLDRYRAVAFRGYHPRSTYRPH